MLRRRATDEEQTVAADSLRDDPGYPNSDWLPAEIASDPHGFLLTGSDVPEGADWPLERPRVALETSMPCVLATGDVRSGSVKRVASAVGEGAIAVQLLHGLLADSVRPRVQPTVAAAPVAERRTPPHPFRVDEDWRPSRFRWRSGGPRWPAGRQASLLVSPSRARSEAPWRGATRGRAASR